VGGATLISRQEHFPVVGSTNDVVAGWLADGVPEVCLAVADEQVAGRGRDGRTWQAPPDAALLMSLGFRPSWLEPDRVWRLGAVVSLAMAEAVERVASLTDGAIRLKWPNDLVAIDEPRASLRRSPPRSEAEPRDAMSPRMRKLAGVLGETAGLGASDPVAIVGIGTNVDWAVADFPPDIATEMTSLRELAGGRRVDREQLLEEFLLSLEERVALLRAGEFDADAWERRQHTNGLPVRLEGVDGTVAFVTAVRVDPSTGGLVVDENGIERTVVAGEIHHLRLAGTAPIEVPTRIGV
jgi:BirA family biotin operon repressor/biotin-[acetyl-CoA-carboxylase] ligase